jgi:sugar O-acyltransferase (sialic acid O-acetyltransferase NeuD family)
MKVVIIGSGGHGAVVADILLRMAEAGDRIEPVAFLDENPAPDLRQIWHVPVVRGALSSLRGITHDAVIVAVGDNAVRRRMSDELRRGGTRLAIARHPSSVVAPDVLIGGGTVISAGAIVNPAARIGCSVILNTQSSVDHHNSIGDYVHIGPGVRLGGNVSVGHETLIGIGSTVMPQLRIGAAVVVGAGAVVTRDLPDGVVAVGAPARVRRVTTSAPLGSISHAV